MQDGFAIGLGEGNVREGRVLRGALLIEERENVVLRNVAEGLGVGILGGEILVEFLGVTFRGSSTSVRLRLWTASVSSILLRR